ncbi:gluconate 2-dehydrogenase subunit 3 family protein [Ktedonospora formicarum]|uniref:Uncharacterized protein n=1 Tax=Ktedonospora formicarum TaxID=2778364 RepID=A0A8J3HYN3_9CHLR|nr:gluconate 2-dehydrogenase subunit 3 family protein [Ktedonospora formicarum]GHO45576.1 hypothetical protein KSX_37390 [Ktedonospora formicarum]
MKDMLKRPSAPQAGTFALNREERAQLNTIIDLLIPSDDDFPSPSSLQLIDEFLFYFRPSQQRQVTRMLNLKRLLLVLHNLNQAAGGDFCQISKEQQNYLLHQLEQQEPAFFQELWTLATHSYYTRLAGKKAIH